MESSVRDSLRALILRFGQSLSEDPSRCEAMLRDLCGQHRREIAVLIRALKQRVAADLLATSAGLPAPMLLGRLRKRLEDEEAMTAEAAQWAVETWAVALGVIDAPAPVQPLPPKPRQSEQVQPERSKPPPKTQTPTPVPPAPSGLPDLHGRTAAEAQAIQKAAAQRLGRSVVFRDPGIQIRVKERVKTGERKRWFSDPEPLLRGAGGREDRRAARTGHHPRRALPDGLAGRRAGAGQSGRPAALGGGRGLRFGPVRRDLRRLGRLRSGRRLHPSAR